MKRVHIIISGRVQGVFFRDGAQKEAERLGVFGWVRNADDGRVEAVLEGDDSAVEELVEWCRHGPAAAKVDDVKISEEKFKGEFDGFEVRC